jgi:hypothetical protein
MTKEETKTPETSIKTRLSSVSIAKIAEEGLEIIANKYQVPVRTLIGHKDKPIYRAGRSDADALLLSNMELNRSFKKEHPEYVHNPITVDVNDGLTDIMIRHEFWEKDAEFLARFMDEVMPGYLAEGKVLIIKKYIPSETSANLEKTIKKYEKTEKDVW